MGDNNDSGLAEFANQKVMILESFRRNGQGVKTPVWFVEDNGLIYFSTRITTGKAKRLRNNPRVRIAASDYRNSQKGGWVEGEARLVEEEEREKVTQHLNKKYGLLKKFVWFQDKIIGAKRVVFVIRPLP